MYQGSNLSRTGQMAVQNEQVSNQLKLLKAKMSNRDTWQQGTNQQLDGYPHTQPTKPSQSPLYPKSDYDFYTMKQQQQQQMQSNSQPKINDPRTYNYQQLQQYKQQQQQILPPQNPNRNDPYLGMNALNRLNQYDQLQKYKEDPYKKTNNLNNYNVPQSYYEQQLNKRQQQQQLIQQPNKYYDDVLSKKQQSYGYQQNNNYDFTQQPILLQNKYDYMNNNNNYTNNGLYNNNLQWQNSNQMSWQNTNQNNIYNNNNNYNQQQQSSQTNQYNPYGNQINQNILQQQSSYNQYNYNQNPQSLSPLKQQQQQPTQQYKYSQHNSQPQFEKRERPFERQQDPISEQYKQTQQTQEQQYIKPQPRKQPIQQPLQSYNTNNKVINPIDELPAVAKKNQTNSIPPEEDDDADLLECPEGCGRRFKENALDKHIKVCKKVFQSKRKEFNSKAHRQINQEQAKLEKQGLVKDKIIEKKKQMAQNGDPKWKKQSEAFRQMINAAKQGGTVDIQPQDDLVECPGCGRKFSEQAADRHIPGCKKRNFKR
ncbi:unnamed protein product [Paramecium pentaurelia]|uniref:C2HC/C3H-type domain-containing protein n=1 Tax=Paramecium pentaurelia TaxID=43138 RepID=A0A8S1VAS1_9CILI|nr:unnamed protein product [Paramecium pentaurelia]